MAPTSKRLFVCCDGTGNDAVRGQHDMISNVARFGRCLKDFGSDGIRQIVYYHEGVGMYDGKLKDGATGKNIHSIIQNAYYFICLNHNAGDEIHLIGFSRGALAVRALACFIEDVGILNKSRLAFLSIMYDLWRNGKEEPRFQKWDEAHLKKGVPITSCAVWDTVRALRTWNGLFTSDDLSFVETRVPKTLKNAFQALSLHETRTTYAPVLWHPERGSTTNVTQTWFAGDHSDVGGGHPDSGLATISLLWMVAQFKEYTNVVFEDIMLLDIMSPLYLHWQKSWLPWAKDEHGWQSHTYTKGDVHGPEDWTPIMKTICSVNGMTNPVAREGFLELVKRRHDTIPPPPLNRAIIPRKSLKFSTLKDDVTSASTQTTEEGSASITDVSKSSATSPKYHWPTIHFTVRILMAARLTPIPLLKDFETVPIKEPSGLWLIFWGSKDPLKGLWEDRATKWETWMFRQWIKAEKDLFKDKLDENTKKECFTVFLDPFRYEAQKPSKAQYCLPKRSASTHRSAKAEDANEQPTNSLLPQSEQSELPKRASSTNRSSKINDANERLADALLSKSSRPENSEFLTNLIILSNISSAPSTDSGLAWPGREVAREGTLPDGF